MGIPGLPHLDVSSIQRFPGPDTGRGSLLSLDLSSVSDRKASPDELQKRRAKFTMYKSECSEVVPGIFSSGTEVAENKTVLKKCGITHVINCIGPWAEEHREDFSYLSLKLDDNEHQDIIGSLHLVIVFIEDCLANFGKLLVHCTQGVSRSPALIIAYLMWKNKQSYTEAFNIVKEARKIANPNLGFVCQLNHWHKTCLQPENQAYRIDKIPACIEKGFGAVMITDKIDFSQQDQAYCFKLDGNLYLWKGYDIHPDLSETHIENAIAEIRNLEHLDNVQELFLGQEPLNVLKVFGQRMKKSTFSNRPRRSSRLQLNRQKSFAMTKK